jgi:Arc/MetJ-type ribon-helix-helix transcriptional regulator
MRTSINLDDRLRARLKQLASQERATMSDLVNDAIRQLLRERSPLPAELPELPSFDGGGAAVDIANGDELYRLLDGR